MSRESRTLLIVLVMALGALFALQYVASRYTRILTEQERLDRRPGPPEVPAGRYEPLDR